VKSEKNLVWIDLEMTGLNADIDVILEIATIITDDQLNVIAKGPSFVIHQPEENLQVMDEWVRNIHTQSGLLEKVKNSSIPLSQAAQATLAFIEQYCVKQKSLLAGNSVWQDRAFLRKYMPEIIEFLHYRIIDVSSIKVLVRNWYPSSPYKDFKKSDNHRALEDIEESIKELQHYRKHFFIST
jgi:oligoribonuclease